MFALIRRAFDAVRLTNELAQAEAKIRSLEAELSSKLIGPSYREVEREFDVSYIMDAVHERVIENLTPFVEPEYIKLMKAASAGMQRDNPHRMSVYASMDIANRQYRFEFRTDKMGTVVQQVIL